MFFISFLHQTTTRFLHPMSPHNCSLSLFYIKPQRRRVTRFQFGYCSLSLFYIKPQRKQGERHLHQHCSLSLFYIKPQRIAECHDAESHCSLSLFYIKPQRDGARLALRIIVLYLFSTSNHNYSAADLLVKELFFISFLHQTTTYTLLLLHLHAYITYFTYMKCLNIDFHLCKYT